VRSQFFTIGALALDTSSPPFDNEDARRAVAYALDREGLVRAWADTAALLAGGLVAEETTVTCQILPPNYPAYGPYCPYTRPGGEPGRWAGPDPSLAHRLVQRSGTAGAKVLIAMSPCLEATAKVVKATLVDLGYRVDLDTTNTLLPPENKCWFGGISPDADVSVIGWANDYPSAASFLVPLLSCVEPEGSLPPNVSPTVKGAGDFSWNFTGFCDREVDRRMQRALDLQLTDPHAAARAFEALDREFVDLAPMIPYMTGTDVWLVSKRVRNVEFGPLLGLIVSQVWVR
jgi:peptide/nickel transport system substrate-binding protein